jgi:hypothetical protein
MYNNPKLKGSNIVAMCPQKGPCPHKCPDCYAYGGRAYYDPINDSNEIDRPLQPGEIVRVNDINDSNNQRALVLERTEQYAGRCFYNTAEPIPFEAPWVLTLNPGRMTNKTIYSATSFDFSKLMFVRFRVNTKNLTLAEHAVLVYTTLNIPVVLTFLAYFKTPAPRGHEAFYETKKRTKNTYQVIKFPVWEAIMDHFKSNSLVHSCSGPNNFKCANCGTCEREFRRVNETRGTQMQVEKYKEMVREILRSDQLSVNEKADLITSISSEGKKLWVEITQG